MQPDYYIFHMPGKPPQPAATEALQQVAMYLALKSPTRTWRLISAVKVSYCELGADDYYEADLQPALTVV